MKAIYLDHAAATPLDAAVFAAMRPFLTDEFYNPSAQYEAARRTKKIIETSRAQIAHWLGARPYELIFTAGGTEANNLAINGVMQQYPGSNIIVSSVEHDSVLIPAQQHNSKIAPVAHDGRVDIEGLKKLIDEKTVLISVQYANNEIGTVQPIRQIGQVVAEINKLRQKKANKLPLYLHTDACQAPAYLDIHASQLGVDFMTLNASKIYGPKQIATLYVKAGLTIKSQIDGGGQERGMRSGTENVANIVGFATALDIVQTRRHAESARILELRQLFIDSIQKQLPRAVINGSLKHRLPNNVHATFPGYDNERIMMELDDKGILCAVGSACSASNEEPSHVLKAIGLSDADAQASLRFTMGHTTTKADINRVVDTLFELMS